MATMRATMKKLCGYTDLERYQDAYESIVCELGYDRVHALLSETDEEIINRYKEDKNLNNIPIKKWEAAGGWSVIRSKNDEQVICHWGSALPRMLCGELQIDAISTSECVSILKACAKMMAEGRRENELWKNEKRK